MEVVATTETFRNMDWLCKNFGIIKSMVHMAGNLQTNNFNIIFTARCLLSYGAAVQFVVFYIGRYRRLLQMAVSSKNPHMAVHN